MFENMRANRKRPLCCSVTWAAFLFGSGAALKPMRALFDLLLFFTQAFFGVVPGLTSVIFSLFAKRFLSFVRETFVIKECVCFQLFLNIIY